MEKVKPIIVTKTRYTARYCGKCSSVIAFGDKRCKSCGVLIDWEIYDNKGKENKHGSS
jgi:uncharacterized OB-fold protein